MIKILLFISLIQLINFFSFYYFNLKITRGITDFSYFYIYFTKFSLLFLLL